MGFVGIALAGLFVWAACGDDGAVTPTAADAAVDHTAPLRDATTIIDDVDSSELDATKPPKPPYVPPDLGAENAQILDAGDGGIPCVADGVLEVESNDTAETANPINPPVSRCGIARVLESIADAGEDADAGDASDADAGAPTLDHDFMTFQVSPAAKNIYVQYHGEGVTVLVTVGDAGVREISKPDASLPFRRNEPYVIEVFSKTGKPELWRVSVIERLE